MKHPKLLLGALLALLSTAACAAVDVNKAGQGELEGIKGIGPALSSKIVNARKHGPFRDWDDLQSRVKGIGPTNSTKLAAEGLTVGGAGYGAPTTPQPMTTVVKPTSAGVIKK